MQKPKRRLGFMVGKSNATLPADDETEAELDQWIGPYISIHFLSLNP